ncbi:MAG: hypothetical protein QOG53_1080 [Frankiales bacterium]|jgi:hypothetical protein|nr:hypothetical protein [Frankiales bacterium]
MTDEARPLLRVVRGNPTADELAALVAVITARAVISRDADASQRSLYADPAATHRAPLRVGAGAWVASGWVPGTRTKAAF